MHGSATPNGLSALAAAVAEQTDELAALGIELSFIEPNDDTGRLLLGVERAGCPALDLLQARAQAVTSSGSPYARFRRALKTGNMHIIQAAAAELPQVNLPDALAVCAVLADGPRDRYERAAVRWLSRLCAERKPDLGELQRAVMALHLLPLDREQALMALQEVTAPTREAR